MTKTRFIISLRRDGCSEFSPRTPFRVVDNGAGILFGSLRLSLADLTRRTTHAGAKKLLCRLDGILENLVNFA